MSAPLALDYVSPLPPVRSGIADYSVDLLPALQRHADVRVLALPGQPVAEDVAARFHPVPSSAVTPEEARARLPLYQMGNNRHHQAVAALALGRPGVLTLHDLVLHHLLSEETLGERDWESYRTRLVADHGWVGEGVAAPRLWGGRVEAALFALPAHRALLGSQRGVLVHSEWAARTIVDEIPELADRVAAVPMGVPLPPPADVAAGRVFRQRLGIPEQAPLLGSFGFQTPIKRTDRVVTALADPRLAAVHLLVVGESPSGSSVLDLARELGVADRVHELGFVPFEELETAIAACDLALNLRYPSAGETSASLLRVLAVGRPAIVSDFAQFAELPDAVAVKVPLGGDEVPLLVGRLAELLATPERLREMAAAAREHVRTAHDPDTAARAIVARCTDWRGLDPPRLAPVVVPANTSRTASRLPGELRITGAEPPWPVGERRRLAVTLTNTGTARWLAAEQGAGGLALALDEPGRPWLPLPRDLAPGESHTFTLDVRRPPGVPRLEIVPQVVGGQSLAELGGPRGEVVW